MAPRANWKGFLRLSLVTCPVALYPATSESEKISFNQLNKQTGHRIKYLKVDADTGDEVPNEDIVKGYELDKGQYIEVSKEELEEIALESTRTIEIDEFVDKADIDPRYLIRPYYIRPDGKVGHDAFAVIRETIREMNKVAIGRVVLTNREHIIALEPMDKGLVGTLLRYPYEVRSEQEYFDEIEDVKVTKDMLDLAKHIVNQKAGRFDPDKFEDHYETALIDLINQKRAGKPITPKERPASTNVVDLMEALRRSVGKEAAPAKGGQARQEAAKGGGRPEGNADAHRGEEAQGGGGEKACSETAPEVGLTPVVGEPHGHEGSLGNDGSLRACRRARRQRADLRRAPATAPVVFAGCSVALGRAAARGNREGALAVAPRRLPARHLGRAPALGSREPRHG
ncbi:DNA end-binding protein Ku [Bradyrhizobium brasilense]|uniref:Non-homologous end joining protein Ku n=2 Tax=Bradyrhizobium TaxID=374 RepID=A0A1G7HIF0_9BRAD|nr:DNA end-binding protein Ku [Bradyrhizobium brasilense]